MKTKNLLELEGYSYQINKLSDHQFLVWYCYNLMAKNYVPITAYARYNKIALRKITRRK